MCTLSGWHDSEIIPRLLDTYDVSTLSSVPTLDITLQKNKETGVTLSVHKITSYMASFPLLYDSNPLDSHFLSFQLHDYILSYYFNRFASFNAQVPNWLLGINYANV